MSLQKLGGSGRYLDLGPDSPHKTPGGVIGGRSVFMADSTTGISGSVLSMSRQTKKGDGPQAFTIKKR